MRRRNLTVPRQTARRRRRRLSARLKRTTRLNAREGEATPRREPPSSSPSSSARPLFVEKVSLECPPQHELARRLCDLSKIDERVVGDFVSGFFRELSSSHRQNAPLNTTGATDGERSRPLTSSRAAAYSREHD